MTQEFGNCDSMCLSILLHTPSLRFILNFFLIGFSIMVVSMFFSILQIPTLNSKPYTLSSSFHVLSHCNGTYIHMLDLWLGQALGSSTRESELALSELSFESTSMAAESDCRP